MSYREADRRASPQAQGLAFAPKETEDATRRVMKKRRIRLALVLLNLWPLSRLVTDMTDEELDAMLSLLYSTET